MRTKKYASQTQDELLEQIRELESRLQESEETLHAIRSGGVDALVVSGPRGERVYALEGADLAYRVLVQEMKEGALTLDPTGLIVFANQQFADMVQEPLEQVLGKTILDFTLPADRRTMEAILAATPDSGRRAEMILTAAGGRTVPVYLSASLLRGEVETICMVVTDLTEQKRSEEITTAEALSRSILEQAAEAIIVLDEHGQIVRANEAAATLAGRNVMFSSFADAYPLSGGGFPQIAECLQRKQKFAGELSRAPGDTRHVMVSLGPLECARGEFRGTVVTLTDITERQRMEERLRQAQKMESIGVLAGGVAHDFNNLLTGILGNASLVLDSMRHWDPNRPSIEAVVRGAERAADLTRQLLAYSGKGRFIIEQVDLSAVVREMFDLVRGAVPATAEIRMELEDRLPRVEADPGQMQQIVMNLVLNAFEALGDSPGQIVIRTREQNVDETFAEQVQLDLKPGTYVCLDVHDTGCGIEETKLQRIFEPFFTTKFQGRGLGLAAVHGVVTGHKGAIRVYSHPGKGSLFTVLLPARVHAAASRAPEIIQRMQDLYGHGTILVVDDEPTVRSVAKTALERYGYTVLLAENGEEALGVFRRIPEQISLVLLDLTMPGMTGEQVLEKIRAIRPDARVLLSSGYNQIEVIRRFAGQKLSGFIGKPYSAATLAEKVKAVCSGKGV